MRSFNNPAIRHIGQSICIGIILLITGYSYALDEPQKDNPNQSDAVTDTQSLWDKFVPPPDDKFDWIQLKSGEWLKGELVSFYNYSIEFDSDELDLQKLDLEDVRQIRTARYMSVQIDNHIARKTQTVVGRLWLKGDRAELISGTEVREFNRYQLISVAKIGEHELDLWSGKLSFGANIKRGNSNIADGNLTYTSRRRTSKSRLAIDYTANYNRTEGITTSNNQRLSSYFDNFYSKRFFWRTYMAEYYRDIFKNIDRQFSFGSGFGYEITRTAKTEWEVSGGLGALYKRFVSVTSDQDIKNVSALLQLGTKFDTEITDSLDLVITYNAQLVDRQSGSYIHHLSTSLSSDLTSNLDLDISLVWDRIQDPQPAEDGTIPKQNDYQLIVGVSFEY